MTTAVADTKKDRKPRQTLPAITTDQVVNSHLPLTAEGTEAMGQAYVEVFLPAVAAWKVEAKAAQVAGKAIPEFPQKAIPNLNKGRMSHSAWMKLLAERAEDPDVILPPMYNIIQNEFIRATNAPFVRKVTKAKAPSQPSDWDVKAQGPWHRLDSEGNEVPSYWTIDRTKTRSFHGQAIESIMARNCETPEDNIVTIGSSRYVIGTAPGFDGSAIFLLNPQETGKNGNSNYYNNAEQACRASLAGNKDIANVVFRIEDKTNSAGGTLVCLPLDEYGTKFYTFPGWATTPGYLQQDGKTLTQVQIRKLGDKAKGVKFVAIKISEPIKGEKISWTDLWPLIRKAEGKKGAAAMNARPTKAEDAKPRDKAYVNINVQCRTKPEEFFPFGFRYIPLGWALSYVADASGDRSYRVIVGCRDNWGYCISQNDAKHDLAVAAAEVETVVEPPAPKVKAASKPKTKAKTKPQAAKARIAPGSPPKEAVAAMTAAAAPVTHDTEPAETTAGDDVVQALGESEE